LQGIKRTRRAGELKSANWVKLVTGVKRGKVVTPAQCARWEHDVNAVCPAHSYRICYVIKDVILDNNSISVAARAKVASTWRTFDASSVTLEIIVLNHIGMATVPQLNRCAI
jgi:hypothetical protein